jgi:hypothetical protein
MGPCSATQSEFSLGHEIETFCFSGTHQNLLVFRDSLLVLVLIHRRLEDLDLMVMNIVQDLPSIEDLVS